MSRRSKAHVGITLKITFYYWCNVCLWPASWWITEGSRLSNNGLIMCAVSSIWDVLWIYSGALLILKVTTQLFGERNRTNICAIRIKNLIIVEHLKPSSQWPRCKSICICRSHQSVSELSVRSKQYLVKRCHSNCRLLVERSGAHRAMCC